MAKVASLVIVGTGLIGAELISQLVGMPKSEIEYEVLAVASSRKLYYSKSYEKLNLSNWKDELKEEKFDILKYLSGAPKDKKIIFVDNTASGDIAQLYPEIVKLGVSIATPNKKAFSMGIELWNAIFEESAKSGALVYHEASVGAGLPIISTMKDLVATGDEILEIEGVFSGSLSYIFNELCSDKSKKFSDVVAIAKSKGFTEPDPRDDLNGMDFARKLLILARLGGLKYKDLSEISFDSLVPKDLEDAKDGNEFMVRLPNYDVQMDKLFSEAEKEGKVLKFSGKLDFASKSNKIGLQKFDKTGPIATLSGSNNIISIKTKRYPLPLVIQGAGAGSAVTAAGVLGDIIKIAQRLVK